MCKGRLVFLIAPVKRTITEVDDSSDTSDDEKIGEKFFYFFLFFFIFVYVYEELMGGTFKLRESIKEKQLIITAGS
jgi:hypothetical protein